MKKIKKFYLKSFILSLFLWSFLPIMLPQIVISDFVGTDTYWYWTTMGWETITGIYYYMLEGFKIPLFIIITLIPFFILSMIIIKIFYYFYYKSH
jgi:hypothetical protein